MDIKYEQEWWKENINYFCKKYFLFNYTIKIKSKIKNQVLSPSLDNLKNLSLFKKPMCSGTLNQDQCYLNLIFLRDIQLFLLKK